MKLTSGQCDAILAEMVRPNKIAAIKLLRGYAVLGLKEAKDAIDRHCSGYGTDYRFNESSFKAEWLDAIDPRELIAEFAAHVRRLEQIIAQFAELADGFQSETPKLELKLGARVRIISCEDDDGIDKVGTITRADPGDPDGLEWRFREDVDVDNGEIPFVDWFKTEELEAIA